MLSPSLLLLLRSSLCPSLLPAGGEWHGQQERSDIPEHTFFPLCQNCEKPQWALLRENPTAWPKILPTIPSTQHCLLSPHLPPFQKTETSLTIQGCPFSPLPMVVLLSTWNLFFSPSQPSLITSQNNNLWFLRVPGSGSQRCCGLLIPGRVQVWMGL